MFNDLFKSFNAIGEDGLQVFQGELDPGPVNSGQNILSRLK
jgi:hypothetical protein